MSSPQMRLSRRSMMKHLALGATSLSLSPRALSQSRPRPKRMGVVVTSYMMRRRQRKQVSQEYPPFRSALELIEHCHQAFNAGGVQTGIRGWNKELAAKIRAKCEGHGMYIEGQISLPKNEADTERFESEIITAKTAGATIHRAALGGRRYEQFDRLEEFESARDRAWTRLRLAEPIAAKHKIKIGIENHKDWRIPDMLAFMEGLSSEYIGTCIDTGNSVALLEEPNETVTAFSKYAVTTHIKDMGVKEYEHGFLLSEVPIGKGFLDMAHLFDLCERANPGIQFSVEMITRDPLEIPCFTDKYWATLGEINGHRLASTLALVKSHQTDDPLPKVRGLTHDAKLAYEETNIAECLRYAETHLGLKG